MKINPNKNPGLGTCSDRALAEKAAAVYYAIKNNTALADMVPGLETFNEIRLAFMVVLEKDPYPISHDTAAKKAARCLLKARMAALKNYVTLVADSDVAKLKEPGFTIQRINKPRPAPPKTKTTTVTKPNQFLLFTMVMKMIQGMRSYGHKTVINICKLNPHI